MRLVAPWLLRWLGFRNVMLWIGAGGDLAAGGLRRAAPRLAGGGDLWAADHLRVFPVAEFMAYNTIAYADVPRPAMSAATSFYSTIQQMALSMGIAVSAAALAGSMALTGHVRPAIDDFSTAFLIVAAIAMTAPAVSARLDRSAGAELSGQRLARARV